MTEYHEKNIGDSTPQFEDLLRVSIETALRHTWTAMPGIVEVFDPVSQSAKVNVSIQQGYYTEDNEIKYRKHPILINVPVHFLGGAGLCVTHNLAPGDSGIVIFSARCIDSWYRQGGIQIPENSRKHSFSDGMFIPGLRALPDKIESFQTSGIEMRNEDRSVFISVSDSGITLKGNVDIQDGYLKHNDKNVGDSHKHGKGTYIAGEQAVTGCSGTPGSDSGVGPCT